ncbi:MAG TPA: hypothetical protein VJV79_11535, partial [Polyangiaceae bacterium]|nr:hypothetical protein [Polyangiaceae bacterium]
TVAARLPVLIPANPFSASYLEVKRRRMAHELPSSPSAAPAAPEPVSAVVDASPRDTGPRAAQ